MTFSFQATTFVRSGHEQDQGNWSFKTTAELASIKALYPELSHWGGAALGHAWFDFSQDVFEVNWVDWMLDKRDDVFLDYCCWRQTRGVWKNG